MSGNDAETTVLEIAVALYAQGRSAAEVADLTDIPAEAVTGLVRVAGLLRGAREETELAHRRWIARERIARSDLAALTTRWIHGAELEDLADDLTVPADLLWDALAVCLSNPPAQHTESTTTESTHALTTTP